MTYKNCKKAIEHGLYDSYQSMMDKLDVYLLRNRITLVQYNELVELLNQKEGIEVQEEETTSEEKEEE